MGVVGGEADGWFTGLGRRVGRVRGQDPVAAALFEVARGYATTGGKGVPAAAASRHQGVSAPAWLLAVAVVRPHHSDRVADTLEMATAAGVPRHSLGACVAYVELAAGLFRGRPAGEALRALDRYGPTSDLLVDGDSNRAAPRLCGEAAIDALSAGAWGLRQHGGIDDVMSTLRALSTPGVSASVAGLIGLRDGCGSLPAAWHRRSAWVRECFALAPELMRSRCHGVAYARTGGRAEVSPVGATGEVGAMRGALPEFGSVGSTYLEEAARSGVPTDSVGPTEVGGEGQAGIGGGVEDLVVARAITEELEAIEERAPEGPMEGVVATTADAAGVRPNWPAPWRQLEGAVQR